MKKQFYLLFFCSIILGCQPKITPKPTADFDFTVDTGGRVQFTNKSQDADRYQWIFTDGQASTDPNPLITFKSNGIYSAQLIAKGRAGTDDITRSVEITTVAVQARPVANFDYTIGAGGRVQFTNKSTNADRYQWIFNDGQASTDPSPVITFKSNGTHSVQLYAKNIIGIDDITKSIEITDVVTTGTALFWVNSSVATDIEIYVDNGLRGIITRSQSAAPACGAEGYVTLTYPAGTYSYYAKSKTQSWSGTFTVKNGTCTTKMLGE
ncbi:PKD domain-containing protein [Spirosoma validum]|uniref:PKD domain-containing protein n=1 Tax=Spirosoma validum TaxID=2771355 RepID=A0A927B5V7_9BACT|nr:PKD domain-containing protein [Spirosoma validum]MBD2756216.1 PKD domain-containing protein [Spirosoma validum]